jgi:nucleotide-binding universal stress UspA family protein
VSDDRRAGWDGRSASWKPSKILVPMDGSPGARKALELAFAIAGDDGEVEAVYVQTPTLSGTRDFASDITTELQASPPNSISGCPPTSSRPPMSSEAFSVRSRRAGPTSS